MRKRADVVFQGGAGGGPDPQVRGGASCETIHGLDPQRAARWIATCIDVTVVVDRAGIVVAIGRDGSEDGPERETRAAPRVVGGSPVLRDVVRDATFAIEQCVIQVALESTGGNRALAAKRLGLSRQSLYVKLRRLGLVGRLSGATE